MKRQALLLLGLAVVVLGLVVALLLSMSGDDQASPDAAPAGAGPPGGAEAPIATSQPPLVRSALPSTDGGAEPGFAGGDGGQVRDWRDHRGPAAGAPPGEGRPEPVVSRETLAAIRPDLLAIVKHCAEPLKARSPPPAGRIVITMHVKVIGGKVQVPNLMIRQDNLNLQAGALDERFGACVRQGFENASLAAPSAQADGEEDVSMAFPVP